jgi:hypothetical protein
MYPDEVDESLYVLFMTGILDQKFPILNEFLARLQIQTDGSALRNELRNRLVNVKYEVVVCSQHLHTFWG